LNKNTTIIQACLQGLCSYLNNAGYLGYDPYDIKALPWVIKLTRLGSGNMFIAALRELVFELFYTFPVFARKVFNVRPKTNAKAMGLLATSYLDLYSILSDDKYLHQAELCLSWLKNNAAHPNTGIGWGYPFDWQSKMLIPAGTPNGIVTTAAGEAFWKHYQLFKDPESLDYCIRISEFLSSLPVDQIHQDQICFSYTPLFFNHVHNLNLFVAEFLIKTGIAIGKSVWVEMGNQAVNYTLSNQLESGAFDYNGPPEKPLKHYDHYHTGFVLRMLHSLWMLTRRMDVLTALEKCYGHYRSAFFEDNVIPKLTPDKKYRIDIHSCAESVCCLCDLSSTFSDSLVQAERTLHWTILNLQDRSGYFYYGILKSRFTGIPFKSKIPYIRWGQAWMLRAFSSYLIATHPKKA
jgi:hypothetical protein